MDYPAGAIKRIRVENFMVRCPFRAATRVRRAHLACATSEPWLNSNLVIISFEATWNCPEGRGREQAPEVAVVLCRRIGTPPSTLAHAST